MKTGQCVLAAAVICLAAMVFAVNAFAAVPGDVDGSGSVDLRDVIVAIQVCAGMNPTGVDSEADVNGNEKIGLAEAVFGSQVLASIRLSQFTNPLGMTFNLIPAGTFTMGSPEDEPGRNDNETQHQVTLTQAFYMQTTEVTQGQWEAVMGENPSSFQDCGDNCPVEAVFWDDIQGFIAKMNERGEGTYRLPTEAEWEYAARAGSTTAFANGGIPETVCGYDPNLDEMGWYCGNSDVTYSECLDINGWARPVQVLIRLLGNSRMLGGCMICTEMSWSGVRIGTEIILPALLLIPEDRLLARDGLSGAVPGAISPGSAGLRVGTGILLSFGAGTSDSGSSGFQVSSGELKQGKQARRTRASVP